MQLAPTSGGRDAYRRAKGKDAIPSREYLFDQENNIELGSVYLNVLSYNLLERIDNEVSREYCVISAYNTGPRNVFKTFAGNSLAAPPSIKSIASNHRPPMTDCAITCRTRKRGIISWRSSPPADSSSPRGKTMTVERFQYIGKRQAITMQDRKIKR